MKKKIVIALSIILVLSNSMVCYADNEFDSIDPNNLTKDELIDAYVDLRDTYNILFDLYSTELRENNSDDSLSSIIDNMSNFSDGDIKDIIDAAQNELENRENNSDNSSALDESNEFGNWIIKNYVDQFNDPTEEKYITYKDLFVGTFSNSATNDSLLYAKILIDDGINIMLYEYGQNQVTSYSSKDYNMILRDKNGNKKEVIATIRENGDRIYMPIDYEDTVLDVLKSGGEIKIYMEEKKNPIINYTFTIPDATGFDKIYNSMINIGE